MFFLFFLFSVLFWCLFLFCFVGIDCFFVLVGWFGLVWFVILFFRMIVFERKENNGRNTQDVLKESYP